MFHISSTDDILVPLIVANKRACQQCSAAQYLTGFDFTHLCSSIFKVFELALANCQPFLQRSRTWIQQGGECQRQFRACAWSQGQQDNWIFSKHIKYPPGSTTAGGGYSTEVYLNITYRFSSCNPFAGCTNNFVTLYKYDTNSIASSTEQTNKNNYVLLFGQGTENTDSRFQQIEDFDDDNVLRRFRPSGSTGFHLGIRDTGTCGYVDRILLYYTPCKKFQDGLVNYPELVRPPEGSPPNVAQACCAPNSHNTTSLSFSARAYSDGRCERGVMCECDAGYILNATETGCNGEVVRYKFCQMSLF